MSIRVFLADDHAVVRDGLRFMLEAQGDIKVIGDAANGRQAVQRAVAQRPDVVIIDVMMPEMNGIEAARQIRAQCPKTQVIVLSMHSTTEHVIGALQAGALGYILKEAAGVEVVTAVRAVHDGRRYLSQKIAETLIDELLQHNVPSTNPLDQLTTREREVLQMVAEGKTSAQIAKALSVSIKTVETYRSRVMHKLAFSDLPSLVKFAIQHGVIPLE